MIALLGQSSVAALLKVLLDMARIALWLSAGLGGFLIFAFVLAALRGGSFETSWLGAVVDLENWQAYVPAGVSGFAAVTGGLVIIARLRRILETLVAGDPFVPANARGLQVIAWTIAILEVARWATQGIAWAITQAFGQPRDGLLEAQFSINFASVLAFVAILVLAAVFQEGARLREDRELTI